jgi:ABC-type ATPase with predicted acetyltransferase domain
MRVNRFGVVAMLNEHHIAISVLAASELDRPVPNGARRCAGTGSKVSTKMSAPFSEDWVKTHRKAAADA